MARIHDKNWTLFNMSISVNIYSVTFCYVKSRDEILRHGKCIYTNTTYMYIHVKHTQLL